ncbi:MAG: hypothetical protein V3V35_01750 [Dehalococcoidia bacterium]
MSVQVQAKFPSVEWFHALQELVDSHQEQYRRLGYADSRALFRVKADGDMQNDRTFAVVFEVYSCVEVRELGSDEIDAFDPDWILEGPYSDWKEMIENIRANGSADSDHTLNRLSLLQHPFRIYGDDQTRVDQFYRQQFSYQEFIDESAAIDTIF